MCWRLASKAVCGLVFPPKSPVWRPTARPVSGHPNCGRGQSTDVPDSGSGAHPCRPGIRRGPPATGGLLPHGRRVLGQARPGCADCMAIDSLIDACKFLRRAVKEPAAGAGRPAHLTHLIAGLRRLGQQCPATFRSPGRPYPAVYPAEVRGRRDCRPSGLPALPRRLSRQGMFSLRLASQLPGENCTH